jgi:hypothetical protein
MAQFQQAGTPVNLAASGVVSVVPGTLLGFYVNSTTAGTVVIRNGGSAGTAISGTITPAIGFHRFPAYTPAGCYATLGNTIDATFFFAAG